MKTFLGVTRPVSSLKCATEEKKNNLKKNCKKFIDHLATCKIPQLFCFSFDWDVSGTQTGVHFARNSLEKDSNWSNEFDVFFNNALVKGGMRGKVFNAMFLNYSS